MARVRANGYVSLLVLLIIAFMSYHSAKALTQTASLERMVTLEAHKTKAWYLADSGIELATFSLQADRGWQGENLNLATGQLSVRIVRDTGVYKITSNGRSGNASQTRYAELKVDDAAGKYELTTYNEQYYN